MPQFFPDGPAAVNLNSISDRGSINIPPESSDEFDSPGLRGSMQQLLSENLGRYVLADFLVGVSNIVRRVGILYSVGRGFLVIYNEDFHAFQVCDIFSLKFISFFPPGSEPSLEELLDSNFNSGIVRPGTGGVLSTDTTGGGFLYPDGSSGFQVGAARNINANGMNSNMNTGMGNSMNSGMSSSSGRSTNTNNGHRTLGSR